MPSKTISWSRDSQLLLNQQLMGCLHEKTRINASFIPGWLFDFVSRLDNDCVILISLFEGTLHVDKTHVWFKITDITHALPVPVYWQTDFHIETDGRFAFTWYCCKISYQSEVLTPVQEPRWTHARVNRAGMTFCGGIMGVNWSELAPGWKSTRCHVNSRP